MNRRLELRHRAAERSRRRYGERHVVTYAKACPTCRGSGQAANSGWDCPTCEGQGTVPMEPGDSSPTGADLA